MDAYQAIRSLPFPSLASALGIDLTRFKKRSNGEYYGSCPIHQSKGNQTCFSYHPDGRFNCFSCSAKGRGGVDLAMKIRSCGFKQAVEFLEGYKPAPDTKSTPAVNPERVEAIPELKPYSGQYQKFKVACPWLEARITDAGVRGRYGIFAYDNPKRKSAFSGRVMIPVKDVDATLYGYLGRLVLPSAGPSPHPEKQDEPKYLFPAGLPKSRFLFGAAELKAGMFGPAPLRYVVIAESPFCCLKLAMWKIPCVSPFGWSLSTEQCQIVAQLARAAIYLPDRNKAGQESAQVVQLLGRYVWVKCPELPNTKDDPEMLTELELRALLPRG